MTTKFFTTPIYYANAAPHIGHLYTTLLADTLSRYYRLLGSQVLFLTGMDEHGIKVQRAAAANKLSPKEQVDKFALVFENLFKKTNITYNRFIRTTDTDHHTAAQALWTKMESNGHIYKGTYSGWYAAQDECFYPESDITNGKAPTGASVEFVEEESYYFKLSSFQDKLLTFYKNNPDFVYPKERFSEVIRFVEAGLDDLSLSRKSVTWGITVPNDPSHTMYVWVDALCNYITAIGYPNTNHSHFSNFWANSIHLIGKDISRFHSIFWPAFLMAADLAPPQRIVTHGWWLNQGAKMSKSSGGVIDPFDLLKKFSPDTIRYFMLRETSLKSDGSFCEGSLINRYNCDLANSLGNLVSRTFAMRDKYQNALQEISFYDDFIASFYKTSSTLHPCMEEFRLNDYCTHLWGYISDCNKFIDEQAPWTAFKQGNHTELTHTIYSVFEALRCIAIFAQPIIPEAASKILDALSVPQIERILPCVSKEYALTGKNDLTKPSVLFPRSETDRHTK